VSWTKRAPVTPIPHRPILAQHIETTGKHSV
jgi:hypothetical protein